MNFISQLLENLKEEELILHLKTIFGVLISKYNKGIRYLLCTIDRFSKYAWVVSLKVKEKLLLVMHFKVFETFRNENQRNVGSPR